MTPLENCPALIAARTRCSGTAIARSAKERLASGAVSSLTAAAGGDVASVTAKDVAECALAGDAVPLVFHAGQYALAATKDRTLAEPRRLKGHSPG